MENEVKSCVKAQIEYDEMVRQQKMLDEFNQLGSKYGHMTDVMQVVLPILLLNIAVQFLSIDVSTLNFLYVSCIAYSLVHVIVLAERKKTNRRMDLMFKMLEREQGRNNCGE